MKGMRRIVAGAIGTGAIAATAVLALGGSGTAVAKSAARGVAASGRINLGPYCDKTCEAALKLGVSPKSVKCKAVFLDDATVFPYGATQYTDAKKYAAKYFPNMKLTVLDGNNDPSTQSSQLDTVVAQGYKYVILDAVVADALAPATKRAVQSGVKVISIDRTVNTPVLSTIKAPDVPLGIREARFVVQQLHGHGNVAILSGTPGASPTIDRTKGIMSVLKKYPKIHIVANINGNYTTSTSEQAVTNLLTRYGKGKLNYIISEADVMTLGAITAERDANRTDVKLASIDGQQQGLQAVQKGQVQADVVYPVVQPAAEVAIAKVCAGEKLPKQINLSYPLVTKANVKKYLGTNFG